MVYEREGQWGGGLIFFLIVWEEMISGVRLLFFAYYLIKLAGLGLGTWTSIVFFPLGDLPSCQEFLTNRLRSPSYTVI